MLYWFCQASRTDSGTVADVAVRRLVQSLSDLVVQVLSGVLDRRLAYVAGTGCICRLPVQVANVAGTGCVYRWYRMQKAHGLDFESARQSLHHCIGVA